MRYIKGKEIIGRYRNGRPVIARFRNGEPVFGDVSPHKVINFIQGIGGQYLELPEKGGPDTNIKLRFSLVDTSLDTNRIFGAYQTIAGNTIRYESAYVVSIGKMRFGDGNGDPLAVDITPEEMMTSIHTLDFNKKGETFWNEIKVGDYINETIVSIANIGIFTRMRDTGAGDGDNLRAHLKIYGIEIYQNSTGVLLHNYLPVELVDKTICLFDTVTKEYVKNLGSGSLIGG